MTLSIILHFCVLLQRTCC